MANIFAILTAVVAVLAFGYFWVGYIKHPIPIWMRIILLAAGVLALMPQPLYVGIALAIVALCYILSATGKVKAPEKHLAQ